jgi:hypothetical protein
MVDLAWMRQTFGDWIDRFGRIVWQSIDHLGRFEQTFGIDLVWVKQSFDDR